MARKPMVAVDPDRSVLTPIDVELQFVGPFLAPRPEDRILPGFVRQTKYAGDLAHWRHKDAEWERLNKAGQATGSRPQQPLPPLQTEEEILRGNTLIFPRDDDSWPILLAMWLFPGAAKQGAETLQDEIGYMDDPINHCIRTEPIFFRFPVKPGVDPTRLPNDPATPGALPGLDTVEQPITTRPRAGQPPMNIVRQSEIITIDPKNPWIENLRVILIGPRISPSVFVGILESAAKSGVGGGRNYGYGKIEVKKVTVHPRGKRSFPVIYLDPAMAAPPTSPTP